MVKQLTTQVRTKKGRKEEKQEETPFFSSIDLQKTALGTKYQRQETLTETWRA
jgi:hypothetical protein